MSKWQKYLNFSLPSPEHIFPHISFLGSEQYLHFCHQGAVNLWLALLAAEMTPSLRLLQEIKLIWLFPIQWFTQRSSISKHKLKSYYAFRYCVWDLCNFFLICLCSLFNVGRLKSKFKISIFFIPCVALHLAELQEVIEILKTMGNPLAQPRFVI